MLVVTLYVLFGDDVRLAAYDFDADHNFMVLNSAAFFLFGVEFLMNVFAKTDVSPNKSPRATWKNRILVQGYLLSFFFWLDLISILTVAFDIPWMHFSLGSNSKSSSDAGRVVRMIRLVR